MNAIRGEYLTAYRQFYKQPNNPQLLFQLLDQAVVNDSERAFMRYVEDFLILNIDDNIDMALAVFYSSLYYKMKRYTRFDYLTPAPYLAISRTGEQITSAVPPYNDCSAQNHPKTAIILHGLESTQGLGPFYLALMQQATCSQNYHIISLLRSDEFVNVSIGVNAFRSTGAKVFMPESKTFARRVIEIAQYLKHVSPEIVIFQQLYLAPLAALLFPYVRSNCKVVARFAHQQPELYYDKRVDLTIVPKALSHEVFAKKMLTIPWPVDTNLVDKSYPPLKQQLDLDPNCKVMVAVGRKVKMRHPDFWSFCQRVLTDEPNLHLVCYGVTVQDIAGLVNRKMLEERRILPMGYDAEASGKIKDADIFLNTFPMGGGSTIAEAYYQGLPVVAYYFDSNKVAVDLSNGAAHLVSTYYNNASELFPEYGDMDGLYRLVRKLLNDPEFYKQFQKSRAIKKEELRPEFFMKSLEQELLYLRNQKSLL